MSKRKPSLLGQRTIQLEEIGTYEGQIETTVFKKMYLKYRKKVGLLKCLVDGKIPVKVVP